MSIRDEYPESSVVGAVLAIVLAALVYIAVCGHSQRTPPPSFATDIPSDPPAQPRRFPWFHPFRKGD